MADVAGLLAGAHDPRGVMVFPGDRVPPISTKYVDVRWFVVSFVDRGDLGLRLAGDLTRGRGRGTYYVEEPSPGITVYVIGGRRAKV